MAAPKKIDWASARKEYIENRQLTYRDISEKYGVSETVVGLRAGKEDWRKSRKSIIKKTINRVEGEIVENNARLNKLHYDLATGMASLANKKLAIAHRNIDRLEREKGKDNVTGNEKEVISEQKMKSLFESMIMAINLQRVAAGLPTSVERKQANVINKKEFFGPDDYEELSKLLSDTVDALNK